MFIPIKMGHCILPVLINFEPFSITEVGNLDFAEVELALINPIIPKKLIHLSYSQTIL